MQFSCFISQMTESPWEACVAESEMDVAFEGPFTVPALRRVHKNRAVVFKWAIDNNRTLRNEIFQFNFQRVTIYNDQANRIGDYWHRKAPCFVTANLENSFAELKHLVEKYKIQKGYLSHSTEEKESRKRYITVQHYFILMAEKLRETIRKDGVDCQLNSQECNSIMAKFIVIKSHMEK